ncbi:MAG: hypothetical protein WA634_08420 [Silvibacterium sp.]
MQIPSLDDLRRATVYIGWLKREHPETSAAMRAIYEDTHNVAEGAGALAVAAVLQERAHVRNKSVGAVLTGGNVDRDVFMTALGGA